MTEATPTETEGAAGEQASTATDTSNLSESDFKARAQNDPDFAWEQVRQFQSRADKLQSAEEKYTQLVEQVGEETMQLIKQYGGQVVGAATNNYARLRQDPSIGELIQTFEQTGQLPQRKGSAPNADEDDEYKTPEEKEIESLKAQIAQINRRVGAQSISSGQQAIKSHMERVAKELDFADSDFEKMQQAVSNTIKGWGAAGEVGERALESLASENGYAQVKGIMLGAVTPEALQTAAERAALRKQGKLKSLATDGPGATSSTGKEPPPQFKDYAEAAMWARNNPESHDSY